MSSKQRTTTMDPMLIILYADQKMIKDTITDIGYVILVFLALAIFFFCSLPAYSRAFQKHLPAHRMSGLLPLFSVSFQMLLFVYPSMFALSIISGLYTSFAGNDFNIMACGAYILALCVNLYVAMYQIVISIVSIHRFVDNRQPDEFRSNLTKKNVIVLMVSVSLLFIMKDIGTTVWSIFILMGEKDQLMKGLKTTVQYYLMVYVTYQTLLFIAMIFQFTLKSNQTTSHSHNVIAKQTKTLGAIKLLLFLFAGVSLGYLTQYTIIAIILFIGADVFLVPLVIAYTEMKTNPNLIKTFIIKTGQLKV